MGWHGHEADQSSKIEGADDTRTGSTVCPCRRSSPVRCCATFRHLLLALLRTLRSCERFDQMLTNRVILTASTASELRPRVHLLAVNLPSRRADARRTLAPNAAHATRPWELTRG